MKYQEYIDLGFTRIDTSDNVEFRDSGYPGFFLSKKLSDKLSIEVSSCELDKPKLYIKKRGESATYHLIIITDEMVRDLVFTPAIKNCQRYISKNQDGNCDNCGNRLVSHLFT